MSGYFRLSLRREADGWAYEWDNAGLRVAGGWVKGRSRTRAKQEAESALREVLRD